MKKQFVTTYDESALSHDAIVVSAGKIGAQVELAPQALGKADPRSVRGHCGEVTWA